MSAGIATATTTVASHTTMSIEATNKHLMTRPQALANRTKSGRLLPSYDGRRSRTSSAGYGANSDVSQYDITQDRNTIERIAKAFAAY